MTLKNEMIKFGTTNHSNKVVEIMLEIILLLLIFVCCYLLINRVMIKWQLDKYKNKSKSLFQTKEVRFKKFFSKFNFIKTKETFLSKQGYPLKLDSIRYYMLKLMLVVIFFTAASVNYKSIIMAILLAILGYFFIVFYIAFYKKSRDSEICNDILNIANSVCLQLSSHISLKDSLKMQYDNCKNKDFKKAMIEFSTCYELSELNIDAAIKNLNNKFEIIELDMFCNALSEYHRSGNIIEILENLADGLSEKQMEQIREITRSKIIYITLGVILALTNIILLIFYPLFVSVGQGFQTIFK